MCIFIPAKRNELRLFFLFVAFVAIIITQTAAAKCNRIIKDWERIVVVNSNKPLCEQLKYKNTIYIIKDELNLSDKILQSNCYMELPDNCELRFDGGKISHGTLKGNNTSITTTKRQVLFSDIDIQGTYIIKDIYVDYMYIPNYEECGEEVRSVLRLQNNQIKQNIYFPQHKLAFTPSGKYSQRNLMQLSSNTDVYLFADISINSNSVNNYEVINIDNCENVNIYGNGHSIIGDVGRHIYTRKKKAVYGIGIKIKDSKNIVIDNLTTKLFTCDGLYIGSNTKSDSLVDYCNEGITIDNCKSLYNGRQGLSVICGIGIKISDCEFSYTGTIDYEAPGCGIDFEPNYDNQGLKNIEIVNCKFQGNRSTAIKFHLKDNKNYENVRIDSCVINSDDKKAHVKNGISVNNEIHLFVVSNSVIPFFEYNFIVNNKNSFGDIHFINCQLLGIYHWNVGKTVEYKATFTNCIFGGETFDGFCENDRHGFFYTKQHINFDFENCIFDYRKIMRFRGYGFGYQGNPDVQLRFTGCYFYNDASTLFGNYFVDNVFFDYAANLSGSNKYNSIYKRNKLKKGSRLNGNDGGYISLYCYSSDIAEKTNAEIINNIIGGMISRDSNYAYPVVVYKGTSKKIGSITIRDNQWGGELDRNLFSVYLKKNASRIVQ